MENRPGASANIGAEAAMRSTPDGYTLFLGSFPNAVNRFLYPNLAYDILADFIPITLVCGSRRRSCACRTVRRLDR